MINGMIPHTVLVWCDGANVRAVHVRGTAFDLCDFDDEHDPPCRSDGEGGLVRDAPPIGFGLWVWEGGAKCLTGHEDNAADLIMRGEWRRPTAAEVQALADGRDPFDVVSEELPDLTFTEKTTDIALDALIVLLLVSLAIVVGLTVTWVAST